jgi:phosphoserine phosphatase
MEKYTIMGEHRLATVESEALLWTAAEFEKAVLENQPKIAVFDCDGTLWSGDSGSGFMNWSLDQGLVSRSTNDWIDERYRAYQIGQVSEEAICGEMVQIYAGLRDQELRAAAETYVRTFVHGRIFAELAALVAALQKSGTELWAVSSTNRWVVAAGLRAFGIAEEHVLAAEVRVREGLITSELVDVPTGEAKATALQRAGVPAPDAVFGNSLHDLAMMKLGRRAYPVNPSPALLKTATQLGWPSFYPAKAFDLATEVKGE